MKNVKSLVFKRSSVLLAIAIFLFSSFFVFNPAQAATADVADLTQLQTALADTNVDIINITANISGITATVAVERPMTINGGGFTLTFTGLEGAIGGVDDGLTLTSSATVNNLTIDAGLVTPTAWVGTYAVQVFNTTATLNNVTAKNGNGGILINNSTVSMTGSIDVSNNGFGGIESSGTSVLDVLGVTFTNTTEAYGKPTIWEDGITGTTVVNYGALTRITKGGQYQYYLTASNGTTINVPANYSTIQAAINAANPGDTINVAAGTYTESGQILINKNLSIVGVDRATTIIKPGTDTGGVSDDTAAWILVQSDKEFNLSNVTLDGDSPTRLINWALTTYGTGTINNVLVKNVKYATYAGRGIVVFGNVTVSNSQFENIQRIGVHVRGAYSGPAVGTASITNNVFVGKGVGDFLDYPIEVGAGASAMITGNTISNAKGVASTDGSTSSGILVTDYYGTGTSATITGNTITGNTDGIAVGYDVNDMSVVVAHNNNLSGNIVTGITSTNPSVDATSNYWGSLSPDFGSIVSGNVTYDPWCLDSGCTNSSSTVATIFDGVATTLTGQGVVSNIGNVTASNFTSFSGLYFEKAGLGKITFSSALDLSSSETQTFLQNLGTKMEQTSGHIKFDARTSTVFAATGATLEMYNMPLGILESQIVVRDDTGAIISPVGIVGGFGQVGSTVSFTAAHFTQFDVDNTPPTGTIVINGGASYTNNQNVTLTLSASDNLSGVTQMEVYKNTTPQGVEPYSTTRLLTLTSGDATKTVKVKFFDAAGNVSSLFTTTIILDTVAPVITRNGDATLNIEYRGTYTEPGATADDGSTVVIGGSVNTSVLGTYTVTYNATDLAGNTAAQVTRTVNVVPKPATVTANSKSKTYGEADPDFTFTSEGLVGGDSLADVVCSVSGVHVNAGTYPIVCSGNTNSNYSVTYNDSTLTINRRPITVTAVSFTKTIDGTSHTTATPITDNLADGDTPIFSESYDNGNVGVNKTLTPGILIRNSSNFIVTSNYEITLVSVNTGVILALTQSTPDETGDVTINSTKPEVVITNPTQAVDVTISSGTVDPKIDVSAFITAGTGTLPAITVTSVDAGNATVAIPASTVVTSADNTWDGVIAAPTVTTVTLPVITGQILTPSAAVEVGFSGAKLSFDQAVRLLLPGQAGKRAGYVRTGIAFTEITNTCTGDDQTSGNALGVDGDCKIDVGSDMVIWTKHFTSFASYTQVVRNSGGGGGFMTPTIFSVALATPVGQVLGTSTEPIPGCGNRTTGFSVVSGQSCATNLVGQILGAEKFVFTKLMKKGSRGNEVKELQKFLTEQGYNVGKIDGIFGAKVRAAVIQFQLAKKLKGDGIVGPKLRDFINK